MTVSIFEDKLHIPSNQDLELVLADCYLYWKQLKKFVLHHYPTATEEWKHSGKNYGWGYRLKDNKRVIIYLTPRNEYFITSMVYGEKATQNALQSDISENIKKIISSAKVYAEGRGFRIEIRNSTYIKDIEKLILIKISN